MILYVPGWLQHHYVAEHDHEVEFESESCFVSPKCWVCRQAASHSPNHAATQAQAQAQAFVDGRWARGTQTYSFKNCKKKKEEEDRRGTKNSAPPTDSHGHSPLWRMLPSDAATSDPENIFKQNWRTLKKKFLKKCSNKYVATKLPQDFTMHLQYSKWSLEWTDSHDRNTVKPLAWMLT